MAIHESLSLWCYNPLIGKKRLGHFYGGGCWGEDYFRRNCNHFDIIEHDIRCRIKSRFVMANTLVFLHCNLMFDNIWNCFEFDFLVDSNGCHPMPIRVLVYCPALTPQSEGAGFLTNNNATKR